MLPLMLLYRPDDNKRVSETPFAVLMQMKIVTDLVFGGGGERRGRGLRFLLGGVYVCVLQVRRTSTLIWLIFRNFEVDV